MGKQNSKEAMNRIEATFRDNLDQQYRRGLSHGTYATCKFVYDRATHDTESAEDRLAAIVQFCQPVVDAAERKAALRR